MFPVSQRPCKTLVVGIPRGGFSLYTSVIESLLQVLPPKGDLKHNVMSLMVGGLNDTIALAIREVFTRHGLQDRMIYNKNFQSLHGGPYGLHQDKQRVAYRKYIGLVGAGDFILNVAHPRIVGEFTTVVHSHYDPPLWAAMPEYADHVKFSPVRNPAAILNSACFSLNALTSEYLQRYFPQDMHDDTRRNNLALYKLTDMTFFGGLTDFLKGFFDKLIPVREHFHIFRWEDLILTPVETIKAVGRTLNLEVSDAAAQTIWKQRDHVNLTGNHLHNYRVGHGKVGEWKTTLTNHHLEMMREKNIEPIFKEFGYPFEYLDESQYTDYQKIIDDHIRRGEICDPTTDRDLFTFAFNKSNINSEKFPFRRYPWKTHTQLERSCFTEEALEQEIWEIAENVAGKVNAVLDTVAEGNFYQRGTSEKALDKLERCRGTFDAHSNGLFDQALAYSRELTKRYFTPVPVGAAGNA